MLGNRYIANCRNSIGITMEEKTPRERYGRFFELAGNAFRQRSFDMIGEAFDGAYAVWGGTMRWDDTPILVPS